MKARQREARPFIDTNVALYLLSADEGRADRAESVIAQGGVISVQVLNEFAAVAARKLGMPLADIREVLAAVRAACKVEPIVEETHDVGLRIADRYGLSIYDAMVVASALIAGCEVLLSEDMQHGQLIEQRLRIRNPFLATRR